jgi:hypothetical protein
VIVHGCVHSGDRSDLRAALVGRLGDAVARRLLEVAAVTPDQIVPRVLQIEKLVRDRQLDLALLLTQNLEEDLDSVPADDTSVSEPLKDFIRASRMFTETLIRLRELQRH